MIDAHVSFSKAYSKEAMLEYIAAAKQKGINELYILEPSYKFLEFGRLYNEVRTMYPCQDDWYTGISKQSLKTYQQFILDMRKEKLDCNVKFGLCVNYFAQHEQWIRDMKAQFDYDIFVGCIDFIDNVAYAWQEDSDKMLWNKYNTKYLYRRYYETMNALITSHLFDGVSGFDRIKVCNRNPRLHMKHTYHKLAHLLYENNLYVEDATSIHYQDYHKDKGLSDEFKAFCKEANVVIRRASMATCASDIGREF